MRKIFLLIAAAMIASTSHAITLFPFFVDVAGNYRDGTPEEFAEVGATMRYHARPSFYKSIEEVKAFYRDVMPFSSEKIIVKDVPLKEGKGTIYVSPMLDDVMSIIYLIETPEKVFIIGYDELKKQDMKKQHKE